MALDLLITQFVTRGSGQLIGTLGSVGAAMGRVESQNAKMARLGATMVGVGALGAAGLAKLGSASIKAASDAQATQTAYTTLLGSASKAGSLYKDIQKFSLLSPFSNAEVAKSSIALLGTGIAADKVIPRLHAVGNAVASIGGNTEKFNGVNAILNKMSLRSKVSSVQLNQLALRGINPFKILQEELGLTADQVANIGDTGIKGAVAVEALARGFEKIGGGQAMERLNKTYAGQVSQFEDATEQLQASLGKLILPDATKFVGQLTRMTAGMKDFSEAHPTAAKGALIGAGVGSLALIGAGARLHINAMKGLAAVSKTAAGSKNLLAAAGAKDLAIESQKIGVAGREAAAIAGTGKAAAGTAEKLGTLARAGALLSKPVGPAFSTGTGPLALRGATVGSAALGAGLGLGAFTGARDDGMSKGYAGTVGVAAAAASMFVPGAAVPIAITEGFRAVFNQLVNVPMENTPENRIDPPSNPFVKKTHAEKAADAAKRAAELQARADAINPQFGDPFSRAEKRRQKTGLEAEAESARQTWRTEGRIGRQEGLQKVLSYDTARQREVELANNPTRYQAKQDGGLISNQTQMRNGTRQVTVSWPESPGDRLARQSNFNRMTPRTA